ncbi:M50 family metallopeptidase [Sporosarcina sp. GW1-11]|uniref:metalloprotease n=1 Tax=Sporosarcina sp. GW1-11 TaxID=2899126 RepID=UPI00294DF616|nr:M50 family metallopeptidase [Sporosarcina sp. GW1-11]MDV6377215.1 M50 family metallopeptidase [Sporosarcina sp. GW1-11]
MKFRIHPILLPIFLFFMVVGGVSLYAMILFSLVFHEFGHVLAATKAGMKIRNCTIFPYGGELQIVNRQLATKQQRLMTALGGPIATAVLLVIGLVIEFPGSEQFLQIQHILLTVNLLPILPLDGGQVLSVLLETEKNKYSTRSHFTLYSIIASISLSVYLTSYLPDSMPYVLLTSFLAIQNIISYRFRKYEQIFEQLAIGRKRSSSS